MALTQQQFQVAIQNTKVFRDSEKYVQGIVIKRSTFLNLYSDYKQALEYGIDYLKKKPNFYETGYKIIKEIINPI